MENAVKTARAARLKVRRRSRALECICEYESSINTCRDVRDEPPLIDALVGEGIWDRSGLYSPGCAAGEQKSGPPSARPS